MSALLGGHVDMMIAEPAEIREQVRAGRLRILATATATRLPLLPDVPTLAEAGFPIADVIQARGLVAPPGIPEEAVAFHGDLFRRMAEGPAWAKYVEDNQLQTAFLSPADTAAFFRDYQGQLRNVLQTGGVRLAR
jgi:putative tricarboxylic transport membrane protein